VDDAGNLRKVSLGRTSEGKDVPSPRCRGLAFELRDAYATPSDVHMLMMKSAPQPRIMRTGMGDTKLSTCVIARGAPPRRDVHGEEVEAQVALSIIVSAGCPKRQRGEAEKATTWAAKLTPLLVGVDLAIFEVLDRYAGRCFEVQTS
jgi:hypothetical protein